ncbi:hypothetical protein [Cupriavidus gilardii]|uniref:hypothetical protein n=1 Tax=Cupriavidus gilardii TaxID=82541 RepID=UPI001ABDDE3E|nr:hypothetical protein [Cupriavidus gilardii]
MTLAACATPSLLPPTPRIHAPRSRSGQPPLRPRDAAQVARTATTLFLGAGSIEVRLAADSGGRLRSIFADLAREYRLGQRRCDRSPNPEAAHAALETEMGIKVLTRLSDCLGALFGLHGAVSDGVRNGDAARRAALMECAAAIADEALVCRDERAVKAGAPPVQRCLTIAADAAGNIHLHKFSRWQATAVGKGAAETDLAERAAATGGPDGQDSAAAPATEVRASLAFRIEPWRRTARPHGVEPQRVLLRCRMRPVRVGDARRMHEAVPLPGPGVRDRLAAGDWRGALLVLLIRLFRPSMLLCRGEIAGRAQLKVYPMPRDGRAPVIVRVGNHWPRREAHRAAIHGLETVARELEAKRRCLLPAPTEAPAWPDDDGVRCY